MSEHKQALVVGIDAYGGGIPPLGSAVRDAQAIADRLQSSHGYDVQLLLDAEANVDAIMASLTGVTSAGLSEESSFVLYFAGHGIAADDREGTGPQGFLLAHDAHLTNQDTWLGMNSLRDALDGLACRHLMMVLDCCYAGAFRWASTRAVGSVKRPLYKSQYERYREGTAWQVLTSASYDETADDAAPVTPDRGGEATPEGHSPFAHALLEGLSGNAADSSRGGMAADGVLTATELYQFIYEKVAVNDRQTPGIFPLKADNKGEFVFLAPGVELNLEPDPPLNDANNPWLGLDSYTSADQDLFFGREEATKHLVERVGAGRFVAVVGPSGSGKSSLIHAGLVPALEAPTWAVVESSRLPADPAAQLEAARMQLTSAAASERELLVIDQFEDLFRCADDTARARFLGDLRAMVGSADGPTVVIGLRSDFEPRAVTELGDLWTDQAVYHVPDFTPDDLRAVLIGPAQAKAVFFEPATLVDSLLDEVAKMPGAAPLLSITADHLYCQAQSRRRATGTSDRMISLEDNEAVGGVVGVAHQCASNLHDAADPPSQDVIRRVFLRLVDQKPNRNVLRNVDREELRFGPEHDQLVSSILDDFVAARLLIVGYADGRDYVEPAHDALVSTWERQRDWLAQSGSLEIIRGATQAARMWTVEDDKSSKSKRLWNQDPRLAELARRDENRELTALEQEFTSVSFVRQRRLARIRRVAIISLVILTVVAVGAGIFALVKRAEALEEAERASSRALAADALNNVATRTDLAALLALESVRVANTPDARGSLAGVLSLPTRFLQRTQEHGREITAIGFSENGRIAATGDDFGTIRIWDVNEEPFPPPQATVVGDAIETGSAIRDLFVFDNDDFSGLVAFKEQGTLFVLDFTSDESREIDPPDRFVSAAVDADGTRLAGVNSDGILRVYEIDDEFRFTELPTVDVATGAVQDLAFSPDGTTLAWGEEQLFAVWSWEDSGEPSYTDADDAVVAIAFSPDDDPSKALVAVGVQEGTIYLVDRNDPNMVSAVSPAPVNQLFDLAFKPPDPGDVEGGDDAGATFTLASTHSNGDVNLFEVLPGDGFAPAGFAVETMLGHTDEAKKVAFAPDGRIASGTFSGEVIWWLDVPVSSLGIPFLTPDGPTAQMGDAVFVTPTQTVSFDADGTVWLWDLDSGSGRMIAEEEGVESIDAAGGEIAVGLDDGTAAIVEPNGTLVRSLVANHPLFVGLVALSNDGNRLVTISPPWDEAGFVGHIAIWDVATGTLSNEQDLPDGFEPMSALFDDDGVVWIGGRNVDFLPTVLKINASDGDAFEFRHSSIEGNGVTALAMSDDGQTLATGAMDRRISLWDTDTLEARPGGEFTGHRGNVTGIVFWDGGETLISSDDAGDVLMWDVSERRLFGTLGGPTDDVRSLEVDSASETLLASSEDGFVWTWTLDPDEWRFRACELAGRNMTQAEWELYGDRGTRVAHCDGVRTEEGDVRDAVYDTALTD